MTAVQVGHARIDCLSFSAAVERICDLAAEDRVGQLVVTPNIQHVVELERNPAFREAYQSASLSLPDGWPVAVAAGRSLGERQPRVAGADLLPAICRAAADRRLTVGFMGGQPGAASTTAGNMQAVSPGLRVVFVHEAPTGFDARPEVTRQILAEVAAARPNILFLGLGAPRQELFAHRHQPAANVVIGVGAALDFCAGLRPRAPVAVQRIGLEWLFRIAVEPGRMWKRYAVAAPRFVRVVLRDAMSARRSRP